MGIRLFLFSRGVSGGQLTAGGFDVGAEVSSEGMVDFVLGQNGLEFFDSGVGWFLVDRQAIAGIVADQVDMK